MFFAQNEENKIINLKKIELIKYDKRKKWRNQHWTCPYCKETVAFRYGKKRKPHFAHFPNSLCDYAEQSESEEHLLGKEVISQWCENENLNYQVEVFLPEISQRPDILIDNKWAIEYQCSKISTELIKKRTQSYQKIGIEVIWILGGNINLDKNLSLFLKSACAYHESLGCYFIWLDSIHKKAKLYYHIEIKNEGRQVLHQQTLFNSVMLNQLITNKLSIPAGAKVYSCDVYSNILQNKHHLLQQLYFKNNKVIDFQKLCYYNSLSIAYLPESYFLPIFKPLYVKGLIYPWTFFILEYLKTKSGEIISLDQMKQLLLYKVKSGDLLIEIMPLVSLEYCCTDYLINLLPLLIEKGLVIPMLKNRLKIPVQFSRQLSATVYTKFEKTKRVRMMQFSALPKQSVLKLI